MNWYNFENILKTTRVGTLRSQICPHNINKDKC